MNHLLCALQALLTLQITEPGPVRFGHPLPADCLVRGLRAEGGPGLRLQWRPLQEAPDPVTGRVWVELSLVGGRGRTRILPGSGADSPALWAIEEEELAGPVPGSVLQRRLRRWVTGEADCEERLLFRQAGSFAGEAFQAGEAVRIVAAPDRRSVAAIGRNEWEQAGLLPPTRGLGRSVRNRLLATVPRLPAAPGLRGRGDWVRSGGTVTNLEFDTALGLARLGLAAERADLLVAALAAARHTLDRDLDRGSGLPFPHGTDHRTGVPEPGHAWLQGMLLVGCVWADDELLLAAGSLARSIAARPPAGEGPAERARDFAWPLLELEAWLRFRPDPVVAVAADRLAQAITARWDPPGATFRFGEAGRGPVRLERAWITGGIVLPALRAHLRRRPDAALERMVLAAAGNLQRMAAGGLPTHWQLGPHGHFGEHRERGDPRAYLMLEGLAPDDLARLLTGSRVQRALGEAPDSAHTDLATHWTMIARCEWVYR